MRKPFFPVLTVLALLVAFAPGAALGQDAPAAAQGATAPLPPDVAALTPYCQSPVGLPAALPPPGSPPFVWVLELCFDRQGNTSTVETDTYQFYMRLDDNMSIPSQGKFVPYDEQVERIIQADFKTLWGTSFLEDLSMEVTDHAFPNGTIGKIVTYRMEERQRVKIVDYRGGDGEPIKLIKRSDIDDKLREKNIEVRLDTLLDESKLRQVKGVLDDLMTEKGFPNANITHKVTEVAGGPKLVNITFNVAEGPKTKIRRVEFVGNTAIGDGTLQRKLKENKPKGILSWITGGGTFKETAFEEDAARVVDYYQRKGYAKARIGQPELKVLEDTKDGETRWIELRIPVSEGPRYRMGQLSFEGNKLVPSAAIATVYKLKPGDWYDRKDLYDGFKKTQEFYGGQGHMEWTPAPIFKFSDDPDPVERALDAQVPDLLRAPEEAEAGGGRQAQAAPVVDITVQMNEGPQYFVNRIVFTGNTTTRDNVIRREMRLVEGNVFDTEALKYSVRRLNQLGYFTEIHGDDRDTKIDKT